MESISSSNNYSSTGSAAVPMASGSKNRKPASAQQLIRENVKFLIEQLEAGHSETLAAYLNAMARFHNYSFGNVLLIGRQRAVTYCFTSLESMNIGGCASMETRDGRLVPVRTNFDLPRRS
jgi:hypothetical protein